MIPAIAAARGVLRLRRMRATFWSIQAPTNRLYLMVGDAQDEPATSLAIATKPCPVNSENGGRRAVTAMAIALVQSLRGSPALPCNLLPGQLRRYLSFTGPQQIFRLYPREQIKGACDQSSPACLMAGS